MEESENIYLSGISKEIKRLFPKRDSGIEERISAVEDNIIMLEVTLEYIIDRLTESVNELLVIKDAESEVEEVE